MLANIWKWIKRIVLVLIALGGAILAFIFLSKKDRSVKEPIPIKVVEEKIKEDQAKIVEKDKEIKEKKGEIQHLADDTKDKIEENEKKPPRPGDAADGFNEAWNK